MDGLNAGVLLLTATATGGGLWFVVKLIVRFQRDFTDRYSARITAQDARIELLERQVDALNRRLIRCAIERGALRAVVAQAGIEWRPEDWGVRPDEG